MNKNLIIVIVLIVLVGGFLLIKNNKSTTETSMENNNIQAETGNELKITPISHATAVLDWGGSIIYTDPVGGAEAFAGQPEPDLVLITDIHGDHLSADTLRAVVKDTTTVVMPQAVAMELGTPLPGQTIILANGGIEEAAGFSVEAIPMYNIPESPDSRHTKGRGNGYVVEKDGKRVYFSGDTSATPEMKALKDIDIAFVTMNLPYTMGVEEAAAGVLAFKPKVVIPYHYRGQDGLSDTTKFRDLVNAGDPNITVDLIDFYPEQ